MGHPHVPPHHISPPPSSLQAELAEAEANVSALRAPPPPFLVAAPAPPARGEAGGGGSSWPPLARPLARLQPHCAAPVPAGAVLEAAKAGDVEKLGALLKAGGSTEEADKVRGGERGGPTGSDGGREEQPSPFLLFLSAAGRLDWRSLGRRRRPPRSPPHAPGGRRQPGQSQQCEGMNGGMRRGLLLPCRGARGRQVGRCKPRVERPLGCLRAA